MVAVLPAGAVIAGLFALLFLLAWAYWGHAVTQTLNVNIPLIGNAIGRLVSEGLEATYLVLLSWFDAAVTPVADFIIRPIVAVESIFDALTAMGQSTLNAVISITTVKIPQAVAHSFQYSNDLANYLQASLGGTITSVQNSLSAAIGAEHTFAVSVLATSERYAGDLAAYVQNTLNASLAALGSVVATGLTQAHQFTLDAYNASISYTQTAYTDAIAFATSVAARADTEITAAAAAAETYALTTATTLVAGAITDIDTSVSTALAGIYTDVDNAVEGAIGAITTGDADILAALKAFPASVPLDLAGVASLTGVTALTLARYLKDCGIPNCQNLSQLGKDLQGLLNVVNDASFLAFIVELIHNPGGAAETVDNAFGDVIGSAVSEVRSLVGI